MWCIKQGVKLWYQCYHSTKYPITTFVHLDDVNETFGAMADVVQEPVAHSTLLDSPRSSRIASMTPHNNQTLNNSTPLEEYSSGECYDNVGHISHIPRTPPIQATYTMPSLIDKSIGTYKESDNIFGIIKLGDNDVCYTSGTIEWVGRKRSFPINSGFKILNQHQSFNSEPLMKKVRQTNDTFSIGNNKFKECDCADILPTVNAIVDHLNALHEAVDIVDLRLNTIDDVIGRNK